MQQVPDKFIPQNQNLNIPCIISAWYQWSAYHHNYIYNCSPHSTTS